MRIFLLVIDSFGIGAMPDARLFHDEGSDTYGNLCAATGVKLPNMVRLGLNHIDGVVKSACMRPEEKPTAAYGRMAEKTFAKDTTAGHYELAGIVMKKPYGIYKTFPEEIVSAIERKAGVEFMGNEVASGTEIIRRLGEEHLRTKRPILYTSQDSVMQIAADVSVVPLTKLYEICEVAREIMVGDWAVGRVIARPFTHADGKFTRTEDRKDYALPPPSETMMEKLAAHGVPTYAVGKISDIFCGRGIAYSTHTGNNFEGIEETLRLVREARHGLVFINLVDTDMLYGHRNDAEGYARALAYLDKHIPAIQSGMDGDDILIVTADHGCDPTTPSTDHSREYVPLLIYGQKIAPRNLGTLDGFDNVARFVLASFGARNGSEITEILQGEHS